MQFLPPDPTLKISSLPKTILRLIAEWVNRPDLATVSKVWLAVCPFNRVFAKAVIHGKSTNIAIALDEMPLFDDSVGLWTYKFGADWVTTPVYRDGVLIKTFPWKLERKISLNIWMSREENAAFAIDRVVGGSRIVELEVKRVNTEFIGADAVYAPEIRCFACRRGSRLFIGQEISKHVFGSHAGYPIYFRDHTIFHKGWSEESCASPWRISFTGRRGALNVDHCTGLINLDDLKNRVSIKKNPMELILMASFKDPALDFYVVVNGIIAGLKHVKIIRPQYSPPRVFVVTPPHEFDGICIFRGLFAAIGENYFTLINRDGALSVFESRKNRSTPGNRNFLVGQNGNYVTVIR